MAAVRSHIGSPAAVASFIGIGMVQLLLGAAFLFSGAPRLKRIALVGVGSLATLAWVISRTWGLPAVSGHTGPESVGPADLAAVVLQVISVVFALLPSGAPRAYPRFTGAVTTLSVLTVSAVASVSLLSVPPHSHAPQSGVPTRRAAYIDQATLTKRSVPVPVSATSPAPPAMEDHVDGPGAPAHSH